MEFLSQFDAHFIYVQGDCNSVADALSRRPMDTSSAIAEQKAQQPYQSSLSDEEDDVCSLFSPEDCTILPFVASLSSFSPEIE